MAPEGRGFKIRLAGARDEILTDLLIDASTDLSGADAIGASHRSKGLAVMLQAARPAGCSTT
ncbi:MAG: hypothetical protein HC923_05440 [Myxococcales bacterium]|nr:hypothetical protein [Myxococcales bacterium]